ncbi:MAG: UDP-N-acetylmuramoyl-tripeptide--D-alanyl-D-alanine ligase [bacterium]|nr:UDP-N-acetylmuramoyl-tripeptide--D-alanyl-D-alanine ligase [bacterium]
MKILKNILVTILTLESRLILKKYKPFIIAVTGSVGKTSTKDAIFNVLQRQSHYVRKSEKSMNSEIGLPLTIIGVPNAWRELSGWIHNIMEGARLIFSKSDYPDTLVLEIGADHPGDISNVTAWLKPDISVITQVSSMPVHVEFFSSPEDVFEEKACLAEAVKIGGTLVLYADNEKVLSLVERVQTGTHVNVISFGTSALATIKGSEDTVVYACDDVAGFTIPTGMMFKMDIDGTSVPVSIPGIIGKTYMYPLLAAAAVGKARQIPVTSIVEGLHEYNAPKGRMNIIPGINHSTLIDDTYNSSPEAVSTALLTLKDIKTKGAKIAVLGDMMELGIYSAEQHRAIGKEIVGVVRTLVTVGQRSRALADEAVKNGFSVAYVKSFDTALEAAEFLNSIIAPGDVVLIKGSQSIRLEKVVKALMKNSEEAEKLLVRQEKEWLER